LPTPAKVGNLSLTCEWCRSVLHYSVLRTVISHDEIANVLGMTSKSFEETYEDKAKELKRTLLEYVKTLTALTNSAGAGAGATPANSIHFDSDGFPIIIVVVVLSNGSGLLPFVVML